MVCTVAPQKAKRPAPASAFPSLCLSAIRRGMVEGFGPFPAPVARLPVEGFNISPRPAPALSRRLSVVCRRFRPVPLHGRPGAPSVCFRSFSFGFTVCTDPAPKVPAVPKIPAPGK